MELAGLKGSVALVTGAAQGIGAGIAAALHAAGAQVAMADIAGDKAAAFAGTLGDNGNGGDAFPLALDITDPGAVADAVARIEARLGAIDKLVNVAGIQRLAPLVEQTLADFDATVAVNLRGTFIVTQAVGRRMAQRKRGAIVTVASNAARVPRVRQGAYCASKAAVSHLMRVFALELAPAGIRVNTVAPGSTETEMIRRMVAEMGYGPELIGGSLEKFRVGIPLGKNATVADVATAVLFLLSDQAGHITMHELVVDGGGALGA
ncbi:MAG: SDR family oxidoreductase [Alphaproteobacteria bacterium]|nr:SDR family oxidoreductase [Alphaproteobacteria bacterium]